MDVSTAGGDATQSSYPIDTQTPLQASLLPPLDNWDKRFISRILIIDVASQHQEQVVERLLLQWLEYYKTQEKDNNYRIEEYHITSIMLEKNNNPEYSIIANVLFEVKPVRLQSVWVAGGATVTENGWIRLGRTYGVFQEGEFFRLKDLPGWGT